MLTAIRILGIILFTALACFTGSKLVKMAQIRGFIEGPPPTVKVITDKAVLPGRYGDAYWLAWDSSDIRIPGSHRISLPIDVWERYQPGNEIEVFYFPRDRWPHHRESVFVSVENFVFDFLLLGAWTVSIVTLFAWQVWDVVRKMRTDSDRHSESD